MEDRARVDWEYNDHINEADRVDVKAQKIDS